MPASSCAWPTADAGEPVAVSSAGAHLEPRRRRLPGQDAHLGRDAAQTAGTLIKTGAGFGDFDWLLIAADGTALPTPLGSQAASMTT